MTDLRKAAEMALEALDGIHVGNMTPMAEENWNKATEALRQALAQPEQEPVGYFDSNVLQVPAIHRGSDGWVTEIYSIPRGNCTSPLYTAPPSKPWVSLTDDQIRNFYWPYKPTLIEYVRFIEAKSKELNHG